MPTILSSALLSCENDQAKALQINAKDYPVHSVTIFSSSKAEIVRLFPIQLKAGRNKIEIKFLPGRLDIDTIRVSGLGPAQVHDLVCQRYDPSPLNSPTLVDTLRQKRQRIVEMRDQLETESRILLDYSQTLQGQFIPPRDLREFLDMFAEHGMKKLDGISGTDDELRDIDIQICREQDKTNSRKGAPLNQHISMLIASNAESKIDLKLTYVVPDASWQPTYEIHAATINGGPSPGINLSYRARIQQSTGEHWDDSQLTLNTLDMSDYTDAIIPELPSLELVQIFEPDCARNVETNKIDMFRMAAGTAAGESASAGSLSKLAANPMARGMKKTRFNIATYGNEKERELGASLSRITFPRTAAVTDSALSSSYVVQGNPSIPSDGLVHTASISELHFTSDAIRYISVPRVKPAVCIQYKAKNTSEYRLLPGTADVIMDGTFVCRTTIPDVPVGDTFACTLGVDPAVKVTYTLKDTTHTNTAEAEVFSESHATTSDCVTITLTNKHSFDIEDISIREVLPLVNRSTPFSRTKKGKNDENESSANIPRIILRKPVGLAEAKDGDIISLDGMDLCAGATGASNASSMNVRWIKGERRGEGGEEGKFEWFGKLGKGDKVELEAEWDTKVPEGTIWLPIDRTPRRDF